MWDWSPSAHVPTITVTTVKGAPFFFPVNLEDDTVGSLKLKIAEEPKIGLLPKDQVLTFNGFELKDDDWKLTHFGIEENSEVVISNFEGWPTASPLYERSIIELTDDTDPSDTVAVAKGKYRARYGAISRSAKQRWVFGESELEDQRTLESYGIIPGNEVIVQILVFGEDHLSVVVTSQVGKVALSFGLNPADGSRRRLDVLVDLWGTVQELKMEVELTHGVGLSGQTLHFRRKILQDSRTLESYGIVDGSTIQVRE